jgi:putative FmdB family regulatory protein
MPIYEFYCPACHTIYNFFSSRIDTEAVPECPRAGEQGASKKHELQRKPASFAVVSGRSGDTEDPEAEMFEGIDEEKVGAAMESWMADVESSGVDPEDPRQMAKMFRHFGEAAGLEAGPKMEEMLRRLEAGGDPDALEEEMDFGDDDEEAMEDFFRMKKKAAALRSRRPRVDPELYFL